MDIYDDALHNLVCYFAAARYWSIRYINHLSGKSIALDILLQMHAFVYEP